MAFLKRTVTVTAAAGAGNANVGLGAPYGELRAFRVTSPGDVSIDIIIKDINNRQLFAKTAINGTSATDTVNTNLFYIGVDGVDQAGTVTIAAGTDVPTGGPIGKSPFNVAVANGTGTEAYVFDLYVAV